MVGKSYINKGYTLEDVLKKTVVTIVNQQLKQDLVEQDGETVDVQQKVVKGTVANVDRFLTQGDNLLGTITVLLSTGTAVDIPIEGQTVGGASGGIISGIGIWPAVGSEVSVISVEGDYKIISYTKIQTVDINAAEEVNIGGETVYLGGGTNPDVAPGLQPDVYAPGQLGGLIIIEELTNKINNLVSEVNALKDAFNSHIHATTATVTPGVVGVIAPTTSKAQNITSFNKDDYENRRVLH